MPTKKEIEEAVDMLSELTVESKEGYFGTPYGLVKLTEKETTGSEEAIKWLKENLKQ